VKTQWLILIKIYLTESSPKSNQNQSINFEDEWTMNVQRIQMDGKNVIIFDVISVSLSFSITNK